MLQVTWDGIDLQIQDTMLPLLSYWKYDNFPSNFCGAGRGFWEWVIPDVLVVLGQKDIKLSMPCAIHDWDWECGEPTWDFFHDSNSRLYYNIKSVILAKAETERVKAYADRLPAIYAHSVDTVGRNIFWKLKEKQGYPIPRSASWMLK